MAAEGEGRVNEPLESTAAPEAGGAEPAAFSERTLEQLTERVYRLLAQDLARQRERQGAGIERWR